jgi:HEAT repeat protein
MAKTCCGCRWSLPLAIVVCIAIQAASFAQKRDWNEGELASPFPAAASEQPLIEQLRSGSPDEKAIACKQLAIYGSKAAVPELARLLSDERFASWSRIALEAIPDPSADEALIGAAGKLQGKLLVGVINSIGVKRSAQAVDPLAARLKDADEDVASAAAVALGKIGGEHAIHAMHDAFETATPAVRSAIAEGGILCAERCLAEGQDSEAIEIYDVIRQADVPKQRIVEATRGAILARGDEGIPLLIEQLQSPDKAMFQIALSTSRELPGGKVVDAVCDLLAKLTPERASLIVYSLGDRDEAVLPPSIFQAAKTGDARVRLAAIELVGRLGDASAVPTLLEIAGRSDADLSQAAKNALATLPGKNVDKEIASRLRAANGKSLATLIELVGERRIEATSELVQALKQSDESIRSGALFALGETIGPDDLDVLISEVVEAANDQDRQSAEKALHAAGIRMPDRERAAAELAGAMPSASTPAKASLLRVLGAMGGPKALETIALALKSDDEQLHNIGTDVLGRWMSADAAPVLLAFTKDTSNDKRYRDRAFKGYLRIARQLKQLPTDERIAIARQALQIAERPDQRVLVLEVLQRCPCPESIELASALVDDQEVRDEAVQTAVFIGEKIKETDPAAAKSAGQKVLKAVPSGELADRARALTSP